MDKHVLVKYEGFDFYVYNTNINHHVSSCIRSGQGWEKEQINFIINNYANNETNMLDVGSEIGSYSICLSKFFKKIISFEPNYDNYNTVVKNIEINKIENIELYNKACGLESSKCNMTTVYKNVVDINDDGEIDVIKLDDFVNHENISFIKIDVEGHEYDVLKGCKNIILKNKPVIYLETHPQSSNCPKINSENFLMDLGYDVIKEFNDLNKFWGFKI